MNKDQENYIGNYKLLFKEEGWKQFKEDIEISLEDIRNAIIREDDYGKLMILKGRYKQLSYFSSFEDHILNFEKNLELEEMDEEFDR